jgi:hypothetical protein
MCRLRKQLRSADPIVTVARICGGGSGAGDPHGALVPGGIGRSWLNPPRAGATTRMRTARALPFEYHGPPRPVLSLPRSRPHRRTIERLSVRTVSRCGASTSATPLPEACTSSVCW